MIKVKVELKKRSFFQLALGVLLMVVGASFGFMGYRLYGIGSIFILIFPSVVFTVVGLFIVFISLNIKMANKIDEAPDVDVYDEKLEGKKEVYSEKG